MPAEPGDDTLINAQKGETRRSKQVEFKVRLRTGFMEVMTSAAPISIRNNPGSPFSDRGDKWEPNKVGREILEREKALKIQTTVTQRG